MGGTFLPVTCLRFLNDETSDAIGLRELLGPLEKSSQGLKPHVASGCFGTTKVVPFHDRFMVAAWLKSYPFTMGLCDAG